MQQPGRADARLALSAGGCPPPIQVPLQRCSHLEAPPHLEDPDHRPSAGSAASRDLCLCNCLGVARGLLPSPIPRASLTRVLAESSPCLHTQIQAKISSVHHRHFKCWKLFLGPKAPPLALLCPHLDPPTPPPSDSVSLWVLHPPPRGRVGRVAGCRGWVRAAQGQGRLGGR